MIRPLAQSYFLSIDLLRNLVLGESGVSGFWDRFGRSLRVLRDEAMLEALDGYP
jgi:hypothetical protein